MFWTAATKSIKTPTALFIIVLLTAAAYTNIFSNQFVADDPDFILNWPALHSQNPIPQLLSGDLPASHIGNYRPVRSLAYLSIQQFAGGQPFLYHIFSLIIHLSNAVLVFLITRQITRRFQIASLASLLFGLHPLHVEAVTFITASFDTLAYTFLFLALYLFIKFTQTRSLVIFLASLTLTFIANLTNESTLVFPLLTTIYVAIFTNKKTKRQLRPYLYSFFIIPFVYFLLRSSLTLPANRNIFGSTPLFIQITTSIKAYWLYLWQLFVPLNLTLSHTLPGNIYSFTLPFILQIQLVNQSKYQLLNFLYLLSPAIPLLVFKNPHQFSSFKFALLWFVITLLPTSNLIFPTALIYSERYSYLASFGFCFFLASIFYHFLTSSNLIVKKFTALSLVFILAAYFTLTANRNSHWHNDITLMQQTVSSDPTNPTTHLVLGRASQAHSQIQLAASAYQQALALNPNIADAHFQLARIYQHNSNLDLAQQHFQSSLRLDPNNFIYAQTYRDFCQNYTCPPSP